MISRILEGVETMEQVKAIPYRMHPAEHKQLKLFCVEKGISMQEFIDKAVQEHKKKWLA